MAVTKLKESSKKPISCFLLSCLTFLSTREDVRDKDALLQYCVMPSVLLNMLGGVLHGLMHQQRKDEMLSRIPSQPAMRKCDEYLYFARRALHALSFAADYAALLASLRFGYHLVNGTYDGSRAAFFMQGVNQLVHDTRRA